jgi:type II secretory pathway pseudopilin PulG
MAKRNRPEGFTLLEAMVTMTILIVAMLMLVPAVQNLIVRSKLEGVTREVAQLIQLARLEAVKRSVATIVRVDAATGSVIAFADVDGVGSDDPPDDLYNPVDGDPRGQTDYLLGRTSIPYGVSQSAPGGEPAVHDLTPVGSERVVKILADGSAQETGAYRFGDRRGNFLEVRIDPKATARVSVKKWDGTDWWGRGEGGHPWEWD